MSIIPETLLFFRVRSGSMLRTYDRFGGFLRVADALTQHLGTDGLSIVRKAQHGAMLQKEFENRHSCYSKPAEVEDAIVRASLPWQLREPGALMRVALQRESWKTVLLKKPFEISLWQAIRRAQRAAKRSKLR